MKNTARIKTQSDMLTAMLAVFNDVIRPGTNNAADQLEALLSDDSPELQPVLDGFNAVVRALKVAGPATRTALNTTLALTPSDASVTLQVVDTFTATVR